MTDRRSVRPDEISRAVVWLLVAVACGAALALLYRDSDQQDAGYHFLFAHWAWQEPSYLVNVWARPLFTLIYSFPALFGYPAAKLFTVAVCAATAWQTWRLAREKPFGLDRPELVIPLIFLQPVFFLLCSTTMTEPLFALIFVVALRWHHTGRTRLAMVAASLLVLVRPEGVFIGVLWGVWVLFDRRDARAWWQRIPETLLLALGSVIWWGAAWLITGDVLWIANNWPRDWGAASAANGRGPWWWYLAMLPLVVGPLMLPPFFVGLRSLLLRRHFMPGVSAVIFLFLLHAVMFAQGWFGAAGYARYLVCVSPAIAIITLVGWEEISWLRGRGGALVLAFSAVLSLFYIDGYRYTRDAVAIDEMAAWFEGQEKPVGRLVYSQAYMCIRLARSSEDRLDMTSDREANLVFLRDLPPATLVFWDGEVGPKWFGLEAADFAAIGYTQLRAENYEIKGRFFKVPWRWHGGPRHQQMFLFYKEEPEIAEIAEKTESTEK